MHIHPTMEIISAKHQLVSIVTVSLTELLAWLSSLSIVKLCNKMLILRMFMPTGLGTVSL